MKRINDKATRREMKQLTIFVMPETLEAFKQYCKGKSVSMNQELENYMAEVSKEHTHKVISQNDSINANPPKKDFKEVEKILRNMPLFQQIGRGFGSPNTTPSFRYSNTK